ncbi:LAME_0H20296g1_1 [Lachancea meyersii CBS 8951]|uniref:LAME_0H20296g1_1 n=1 Tax=Lachancea meyersii CBS 8951 TaxID=1266667 RepID=A0A1G4KJD6_9SACH|nr:LAME_0H20296g1_1 [Lachancea meyersii CBS 8951]
MFGSRLRLLLCFLVGIAALAYAFTPEEVEMFQLQNEIVKAYKNKDLDFYKLLKLPKLRESTSQEIRKNLRKLSKTYHPDKNKKYRKLYERLTLATKILENDSYRKTYDYYLKNGFPAYDHGKGGFYFSKVQPKTWFIATFLYVACGIIHFVILRLQNDGNRTRIERFLRDVRSQDNTSGLGEKRLLFKQSADDEGKEIIVRMGDVYVVQPDGVEAHISTSDIKSPGLRDCMLVTLPLWFWNKSFGRLFASTMVPDTSSVSKPKASNQRQKSDRVSPNAKGNTMELPNGKVLHSRKKNL